LPTVKYVGLQWPLFPNPFPIWQLFASITAALKDRADQILMLPGKATEQDGGVGSLFRSKCALHWAMEVLGRIKVRQFCADTRVLLPGAV
jgi:hypothetical protein